MCSFSTSIIERPRHFLCLQHTPATKPIYTQNSEEPDKARETGIHHTAFEFDTFDMWLNDYIRLRDRDIRPFLMLDHGITMSVYYQDPDGNGVEIQVDGFGDWADSSEWIATSLEFARNPIGEWFDPEKLVQAREDGLSFQEIHERARAGEYLPDEIPEDIFLPEVW